MGMTMHEESGMFYPADWGLSIGDMLTLMGVGAGQGGQGGGNSQGGKGGNSGFVVFKTYKLLTLDPIPVSIGLGGAGGMYNNMAGQLGAVGGDGGDTTFGSILTAKGATNTEGEFYGGTNTAQVGGAGAGGYIPGLKNWGGNAIVGRYDYGATPADTDNWSKKQSEVRAFGTAGIGYVEPYYALSRSEYNTPPSTDGLYRGGKKGDGGAPNAGAGGSGYGAGGGGAGSVVSTLKYMGGKGANGWLGIYW